MGHVKHGRKTGVRAYGIRLPIISRGDDLAGIITDSLLEAMDAEGLSLEETDVIGVTEAIVAKSQSNYASLEDIASDIRRKFPEGELGLVFPIMSRNRFVNILKGISLGVSKLNILLQYPSDEVGNPIMDINTLDTLEDILRVERPIPAARFKQLTGGFVHPFTGVDYISMFESISSNISVHISDDPRDILKLTKNVLVCEIHSRERTKARIIKAGANNVYLLTDILTSPGGMGGYNAQYGVLGSNIAGDDKLKLFPRDCDKFLTTLRERILAAAGTAPEALIYGDGAFKDPAYGIWELADPVVAPAYTERLGNMASEIKLKYVADKILGDLEGEEKRGAITEMIREKKQPGMGRNEFVSEGTTPRRFADLLGSLCDLVSGSGDKGTPVVLVKGYFDDYSDE